MNAWRFNVVTSKRPWPNCQNEEFNDEMGDGKRNMSVVNKNWRIILERSKTLVLPLIIFSVMASVPLEINSKLTATASVWMTQQGQIPKDPCWFMTLKDSSIPYQMIKAREDRDMRGYPGQIPLSEAVRIFNEETHCVRSLASFPDLTEAEVIAAIAAGPDRADQGEIWLAKKDALWRIASQKMMPKGALLVVDGGYRIQDSPLRPSGTIEAKGIRITLLLGLENRKHGDVPRPSETLLIRKTFTEVRSIK